MSSPKRRLETDVMKLMMKGFEVTLHEDSMQEFFVKFLGPKDSAYENGVWKVHVTIPPAYPYKSPSIGFMNKIFHANIDEMSGSVCLDVINQTWTPMYDLTNIFDTFLPQLLLYPNPTDPLNAEAASLLLRHPEQFKAKVKDYVQRFASEKALAEAEEKEDSSSASDLSSLEPFSDDETKDMEM